MVFEPQRFSPGGKVESSNREIHLSDHDLTSVQSEGCRGRSTDFQMRHLDAAAARAAYAISALGAGAAVLIATALLGVHVAD